MPHIYFRLIWSYLMALCQIIFFTPLVCLIKNKAKQKVNLIEEAKKKAEQEAKKDNFIIKLYHRFFSKSRNKIQALEQIEPKTPLSKLAEMGIKIPD